MKQKNKPRQRDRTSADRVEDLKVFPPGDRVNFFIDLPAEIREVSPPPNPSDSDRV